MRITRFQIAKKDIIKVFDANNKKVFAHRDIKAILETNRRDWRLNASMYTGEFIEQLRNTKLIEQKIVFPKKTEVRYTWGVQPVYGIAMTLVKDAYFTHYSAMYFNGLTDQIPKTIYLNYEQTEKRMRDVELLQGSVDRAFKNQPRMSNRIGQMGDYKICILNGKFTDKLGVVEMTTPENFKVLTTDLERTLIDITVRPQYAGGVFEVLNAFRRASKKVSINKLSAMLSKINYIYPYRQAIGFYLEQSGEYKESQIRLMKKEPFEIDFYLMHKMKNTEYSKDWRLFYPSGFANSTESSSLTTKSK